MARGGPVIRLIFTGALAWLALTGAAAAEDAISPGDTAWMLGSTALVLLMTPALAFFYGGLVRSKNALNTMMMSVSALGIVGIAWVLGGYSLAFAPGNGLIGGLSHVFLGGIGLEARGSIPHLLFMAYQGTFAIITAALISGAVVERMRFGAYLLFIFLWSLLVYAPVAHWVWGGGWLGSLGALDFAGGTVVHINAGVTAVVVALVLGSRREYGRKAMLPHNVPFVLLGTALLWFGWFGFNGGSALAANGLAVLAFVNTMLAPMAALVTWLLLDLGRTGRSTAVGAATAIIVGLVAITPGAGFVGPLSALCIGFLATFPSYFAIQYRTRTRLDDSLDVFAGHGLGGIAGAVLTGVFAQASWGGTDGLLFGNPMLVGLQIVAVLAVIAYSALGSLVLLKLVAAVVPLKADEREEGVGLDVTQHGEEAYTTGEGAILVLPDSLPQPAQQRLRPALALEGGKS
ncbi:MAG: ammonium transporter [Armatimonadetes bacterium]|nr:ammonium transporter [Armatimonadota bacterium]